MFGKPRTRNFARLHAPALMRDTTIKIDTGLDLVEGDQLSIAPTSYSSKHIDFVNVVSYDNTTGAVSLDSKTPIRFYHYGAEESTASTYNGVDIRAEVLILSRNVKIIGEDIESWGGQIVTSDTIEADLTLRNGSMRLDNVEIYNCS
jgi:hypothetical protein